MSILLYENHQLGNSQHLYTCQQGNFPEWTVFLSPDRVTPDDCLKLVGGAVEIVSHNFIYSDIKLIFPNF
jgi:hypothetical protein